MDTNQPTIVPPPALFESSGSDSSSPLQSYAVDASPMVVDSAKKRPKVIKRREARVAAYEPTLSNTPAVARAGSTTTAPPIRLSFAEIISGQLVRNLFNLH